MIPVKPQESSSRRSSILKPPKSRHPLQFVDFNSSPENSPTSRQTRRVSFAEKKHVKEFVDSVERGTLWDNTYEENEFGGGKFACSSHYEDVDNVENQSPMDEESRYSIRKVVGNNERVEPNNLAQLEGTKTFLQESTAGTFTNFYKNKDELGSIQNERDISQAECDLDLTDAVAGIETTKETEQINNSDNYTMHGQAQVYDNQENEIETNKINKTVWHDASMELTAAIPFWTSSHPGTSKGTFATLTKEKQYFDPSSESCLEGIEIRSNKTRDLEDSIDFDNKTMEFTKAVTSQNVLSKFILNKENIRHLPYIEGHAEDSFMECTTAVEKTTRFENQSIMLTECIPSKYILISNTESTDKIYGSEDDVDKLHQEKSSLILDFDKRSNTVTEKTKSLIKADDTIDEINRSANHENFNVAKNIWTNKVNVDRTISERTEKIGCFQNVSMNLKTLVATQVANENLTENIKLPHKKRDYSEYVEYCQDTSNKRTKEYLEEIKIVEEEKTKLFKDMSMEMTRAIPLATSMLQERFAQNFDNSAVHQGLAEPVEEITVTNNKEEQHNVSRTVRKNDQEMDTESDMTKLFKNAPMEMTTVIRQATPTVQQDMSLSFKDNNDQEKLIEQKKQNDVIEQQNITNTVTKNIFDKMMGETRKSILNKDTSMEQETELSESTISLHTNRTYNIKKPWIRDNLSEAIGKMASTGPEESKKKDTADVSISNEGINENILLQNVSMEITNVIPTAGSVLARNISGTKIYTDTNETEQLSVSASPTKRTYVIQKGFCTQVNDSQTDITLECKEAYKNNNVSDRGPLSTCNNESMDKDNSLLLKTVNVLEDINKDTSNISVVADEMYMIDIENRPTCLISNDSYEELNDNESHELSSEEKELTHCEENYKCISAFSTEDIQSIEASIDISSHNDVPEDPFVTLMNSINVYSERDDCVWTVRCLDESILALDFISSSLVVAIIFGKDDNKATNNLQKINIISRLTDEADPTLRLVHRLIMDKIDPELLIKTYCMLDDFFPLMEHISKDVIFAMDFMFEYERLHNTEIIDIIENRIQFTVWTKTMHTILNISIEIKPLDIISRDDVEVECILGSIRVDDIKKLIVNAKKDHRYLTRCINDVKEYLTWMEETG